jgi:hypothetical protein
VLRFLGHTDYFTTDTDAVERLLSDLKDGASGSPSAGSSRFDEPGGVWAEWLTAVRLALLEPRASAGPAASSSEKLTPSAAEPARLTALQSFDAMIRLLEAVADRHPVARDIVPQLYYSEVYDWSINTRDPGTWGDWIDEVQAKLAGQVDGPGMGV